MNNQENTYHTFFIRLLIFFAPTIILLSIFELSARLFLGNTYHKPQSVLIPDLILNHKWQPNLRFIDRARAIAYPLHTNAQSWVEEETIPFEKPPDTMRIFYVGDSNVQGVVAPYKKMVSIVKRELQTIAQKTGKSVEVINTGTSSYSPILYYLLIKNQLLSYAPDLIVITVDMTDVRDDYAYRKLAVFDPKGDPIAVRPSDDIHKTLYRMTPNGITKISLRAYVPLKMHEFLSVHSVLYEELNTIVRSAYVKEKVPINHGVSDQTDEAANWLKDEWTPAIQHNVDDTMAILGKTIQVVKGAGVKVALVSVPHYPQFTGEWSARPHEELRKLAQQYDCPYLNSYEALKPKITNTPVTKYYWNTDPTHFNEEGNALWAQSQLTFLRDPKNKFFSKQ